MSIMQLLAEAIAAHGGQARFDAVEEMEVHLRCGGIALATRGHPRALARLHALVRTDRPHVRFLGWPQPGANGVLDGYRTRIEDDGGVRERAAPRRRLWWDDLDVLYFAGYALWNYLCAPFLFARPGFDVRELHGRRFEVTFPAGVPTHSRRQIVHLDANGRIRRLDYTAEVFGRWARAANRCLEYAGHDGLVVPVRRRVVPRGPGGLALPGPTLVSIAIDDLVVRGPAARPG